MKKIISMMLSVALVIAMVPAAWGATTSYAEAMEKTNAYIIKTTSPVWGNEWNVMSLARAKAPVDAGFYKSYAAALMAKVKETKGVLSARKNTEYSKAILVWTAMGRDASDVAGYNLLKGLADFDEIKKQGANGPIWALIALDSRAYKVPAAGAAKEQTTRQKLVDEILSKGIEGGGYALSGNVPDADMTAMALQAVSPYSSQPKVKSFIDQCLDVLSKMQGDDGGYMSNGMKNAESNAQVLVALTALRIDPAKDSRFVKKGNTVLDALLKFYDGSTGGFRHVAGTPMINPMATEQGSYALVAYDRFVKGEKGLYDMSDVIKVDRPNKVSLASLKSSQKKSMTVKWKKLAGAKGYQIAYSANSKFRSAKYVYVGSKVSSKTIKKLNSGKLYYVKVRAYREDGFGNRAYGKYSAVRKVKII